MIEMAVVGVRMESPQTEPVLLLRESGGNRFLPIWIGQAEAAAISVHLDGVQPARPLTHDLIVALLEHTGRVLREVHITDLHEGTFYAELHLDDDVVIAARPSDSIAVAVRLQVPVFADEQVLAEAGLHQSVFDPGPVEDDEDGLVRRTGTPEDTELLPEELEKFKEFIDNISPEDFEG